MSEIPKTYEPPAIEEKWYAEWLAKGCFTADPSRVSEQRPAYSIVIPPPNVTGVLTLGHVLNATIQDILARRARMLGKEVLWLPGTDHAGIATQTAVERSLKKAGEIKHRDDLGREAFLAKIWEWKEKHGGIIIQQLKKLGASCDWARERFTMDPEYSRCVQQVFVDLHEKGHIYRGKRMVNWCPTSLTALSDEEVIMKPQNGTMYHFRVEVMERLDSPASEEPAPRATGRFLTIATTRPETIPGDTAVAVNPKDPRYAGLIGQQVRRPLPSEDQALIPIIGDDAVDFEFGTGVLKVTPAHDKADFEIGQRHQLPAIDIMQPNGVMNALAGSDLAGLDRFEARKIAIEKLRELGLLEKEEPYQNNVGYSERADVPVEPRLSEQWFLRYPSVEKARQSVSAASVVQASSLPTDSLKAPGIPEETSPEAIAFGHASPDEAEAPETMSFYPERWVKVYDHWMGNLQDWCISRQLWWGHRIPVWYRKYDRSAPPEEVTGLRGLPRSPDEMPREELGPLIGADTVGSDAGAASTGIYVGLNPPPDPENWEQDPDVLDTWFSSWLWPFATMGWPENTSTLAKFYPTTDLVTGPDIIFFWVARMIMAGFEYKGELPFKNVYFTGIIRDKQGRKMSKSLGNSPDPLDLISNFGADALRFGVMRSAPLGADILFDEKNVELGRNFCTKLWNAARFRQMQGGETEGEIAPALLTTDDKWILLRLDAAIAEVSLALDEYRFSDAAQALYRFFWSELCDWYLEAAKASLNGEDAARKANTVAVMDFVLAHTLRLFHPFLPFITEELWHALGYNGDLPEEQGGQTIMFARWPQPLGAEFVDFYGLSAEADAAANTKYATVTAGRALRRDFNIASNKRVRFVLKPCTTLPAHESEVVRLLLNAETLEVDAAFIPTKGTPTAITPLGELYLPLDGLVDSAAERDRLGKEIAKVDSELAKVRAKLANETFVSGAPEKVVEEHRQREADWTERQRQLTRMLDALGE